ncbi:MAG: rhomboid family intramembrane serine protease [Caulobacteraceae bacterium]|nr:rhomboid family intramembrane serine protease [Caulobacteraceae bacterium]
MSIPIFYFLQSQVVDLDSLYRNYGLMPYAVEQGEYVGLFTSLLLHGNWAHALMNAAFALAFGVPVSRLMGTAWHHGVSYILFYVLCGVAANVIYVWLHAGSFVPLIGASGAVSGLMGATARLINTRGVLGPVLSRTVFIFGAALVAINLVLGFLGDAPGSAGMPIAWEAHLAGFFAGLLLIGPWAALFGRRSIAQARTLPPLVPTEAELAAPPPADSLQEPPPAEPSPDAPVPPPPLPDQRPI